MADVPAPAEVSLPGRILARAGLHSDVSGAALRLGELAVTTDDWYGWLGDESQNPPHWPTSKTVGDFDWSNLNPTFKNINVSNINGKPLGDLFYSYITTGPTPVITIINDNLVKTVYSPNADFADLGAAYAWLSQRTISTTGSVTLVLPAMKIVETNSYVFNHPNGDRISWIGAPLKRSLPNTQDYQRGGFTPAQQASDTSINLTLLRQCFATEIYFTNGGNLSVGNLAKMSGILITSDGATGGKDYVVGMTVSNASMTVDNVAVIGFDLFGVQIANGGGIFMNPGGEFIILGNGAGGIDVTSSSIFSATYGVTVSISNGGKHAQDYPGAGIQVDANSFLASSPFPNSKIDTVIYVASNSNDGIHLTSAIFSGQGGTNVKISQNGGTGLYVDQGSRYTVPNTTIDNNNASGVVAGKQSSVTIANGHIVNNKGYGMYADNLSLIDRNGTEVGGNAVADFSPTVGSSGNNGAIIV